MLIQILYKGQLLDSREIAVLGTPRDVRTAKKQALKFAIDSGQVSISQALGATFLAFNESGQPINS